MTHFVQFRLILGFQRSCHRSDD